MRIIWFFILIHIAFSSCRKREFVESPYKAIELLSVPNEEKTQLDSLYRLNEGKLFWDHKRKSIHEVINVIHHPEVHGIFKNYHAKELLILYSLRNKRRSRVDSTRLDVLTSLNLIRYINDINSPDEEYIEDKATNKKVLAIKRILDFFIDPDQPVPAPSFIFYSGLQKQLYNGDITINYNDTLFIKRIINLHRFRSESIEEPYYILVNIPSNLLYVVEKNKIIKEFRIITGKPNTPTPVLSSKIKSMVINPEWKLPFSISAKEILPILKINPDYLADNNMILLDRDENIINPYPVNWEEMDSTNFRYRIIQIRGEDNALGYFQFFFDNKESVYIHDTPTRYLFNKNKRHFSHGCIRVENPMELLLILLNHDKKIISESEIRKMIDTKEKYKLKLKQPVPVLIRYYTVLPVSDSLIYYNDIYRKDSVLIPLLKSGIQNRREL